MVKRVSPWNSGCPVARSLDVIGDWWSLLIIRDAFHGVRRFSEFQTGLGIARGVLATRLRDLTERGILEMAPASDGTAYREYVLTGKRARPVSGDCRAPPMGRRPSLQPGRSTIFTGRYRNRCSGHSPAAACGKWAGCRMERYAGAVSQLRPRHHALLLRSYDGLIIRPEVPALRHRR
ncbi:helix-turn-helix domain-containing protein [Gemmobacter sp. 24YEA27]|uniref:winged helix-turn-helix transcriptional regulator n=1 Tax=Gemmobacter sp. 24YEA27 TaxID=3040672 RepID=UPI0024B3BA93|nr:helix-turn-helix domain-containing protein [Gemmobacter sp. 24YEA27]